VEFDDKPGGARQRVDRLQRDVRISAQALGLHLAWIAAWFGLGVLLLVFGGGQWDVAAGMCLMMFAMSVPAAVLQVSKLRLQRRLLREALADGTQP
jgi:hypothetical protein